jgi:ABC-type lipoprotein release transport system permease subunit
MATQISFRHARLVSAKLDCSHCPPEKRTGGRPIAGSESPNAERLGKRRPQPAFFWLYDMKEPMAATLATQRIEVALLAAMASLALLLSAVGIFALVAKMVAQRTREIGIGMALGSTVQKAMIHIGRTGVAAAALGLFAGLLLSAGALRVMRSVLYDV